LNPKNLDMVIVDRAQLKYKYKLVDIRFYSLAIDWSSHECREVFVQTEYWGGVRYFVFESQHL
jgi:hypothetical protein